MFNKNNWKEPIYKDDVISVLINGFLVALLGGILGGALEYLFDLIQFSLSINLFLISILVGWRVRKGYYSYHILYPILAIVFFLFGLLISHYTYYSIIYVLTFKEYTIYNILLLRQFWLSFILQPVDLIVLGYMEKSSIYIIMGIIDLAITVWSFYFTFRMAKGLRR